MTGMKKVVGWIVSVWAAVKHRAYAPRRSTHTTSGSRVVAVCDNEVSQHPVGQIATIGEQHLGIVDLGTDVSNKLRLLMDKNILTRGEPFQSGGRLGSACLPSSGGGVNRLFFLVCGQHLPGNREPCHLDANRRGGRVRSHGTGWHCGTRTIHCGGRCHDSGRRASDVLYDDLVDDDVCTIRSNSSVVEPARHSGGAAADERSRRGLRHPLQRDGSSQGHRC